MTVLCTFSFFQLDRAQARGIVGSNRHLYCRSFWWIFVFIISFSLLFACPRAHTHTPAQSPSATLCTHVHIHACACTITYLYIYYINAHFDTNTTRARAHTHKTYTHIYTLPPPPPHRTVLVAMHTHVIVHISKWASTSTENTPPVNVAGDDHHECKWSICASWWQENTNSVSCGGSRPGCSNQYLRMQLAQGPKP